MLVCEWINEDVLQDLVKSVKVDIVAIEGEGSMSAKLACQAFDAYIELARTDAPTDLEFLEPLLLRGEYGGLTSLGYW
jgi:hypothetical protein